MSRRNSGATVPFIATAGWLFADLLLALAVIFLATSMGGSIIKPGPTPTPTPTPTPSPTPTVVANQRILERYFCEVSMSIGDPDKFVQDFHFATTQLEPQINPVKFLQGRQVGIALAYGGESDGNVTRGLSVSNQVYNVLRDLGNKGPVFKEASYYTSLFNGASPDTVTIDVYLVARQNGNAETCGNISHKP